MKLQGDHNGRKGHLSVATEVLKHLFRKKLFCFCLLLVVIWQIFCPFFLSLIKGRQVRTKICLSLLNANNFFHSDELLTFN